METIRKITKWYLFVFALLAITIPSLAQETSKSEGLILSSSFRMGVPMLVSNLSLLDERAPLANNPGVAASVELSYKKFADRTSLGLLVDLGLYNNRIASFISGNNIGIENNVFNTFAGIVIRHYHIDNDRIELAAPIAIGYMHTWNFEDRQDLAGGVIYRTKSMGAFAMTAGMELGFKVKEGKCIGAKVDLSAAVGKSMVDASKKMRCWLSPSIGLFFRHSL